MKLILTQILIVLFTCVGLSQVHDLAALQNDAAGKRVIAYFEAFNSADEGKLKTFFSENIAAASLQQRGIEPRLAFHRQVKTDYGKVELSRVVSITAGEIKVVGRSAGGAMLAYSFEISPDDKKIAGMGIEPQGEATPPTAGPADPPPTTAAELPTALDKLFDARFKADQFSGVVMVAKDGTPVFSKAYGLADKEKNVANKLETKFNLGSINKMFTRIAIGQLVKQGKLSFTDKLSKVLPDYPNKAIADKITIGQIVTMSSGLGDIFTDKYLLGDSHKIRTLTDYVPLFVDTPLQFEPGTSNRYSNAGYVVLGLVIEKLSGKSYYDYVHDNVFVPAGMTDTASYEIDKLPANTAIGYMKKGSPARVPNAPALPGRGSSAGGGYSTASDMLKFAAALKAGKLLIPSDDGTFPTEFAGTGFAGGSEGVNSVFTTNGKTGYTVVILSNFDPPSAEQPIPVIREWLKQVKQ